MKALNTTLRLVESKRETTQAFTGADYQCVRNAMGTLADDAYKAVLLRFWGNYSIEEVAASLKITWDEADSLLSRSFEALKLGCLSQSSFSRKSGLHIVRNVGGGSFE